ncbi:probable UDP-sugar transporter protein SLC35A5 [Electrophorus electricus]|uniref:Solute carrier family 35 member A5 n=1 Tax=Electrophorus electricus TaxID=8005 RepID=A0A4W4EF41_ELEEL|nr:probable UDP-sugar transporter protein SLC35A5 [Electrophorus electricus]XP_026860941.2 probable UDP-sugar transporter protein SLC35A5 [Electrophorus electricus]XP_026860942.2 probable UDP-sugar transporter protein SLC35A5 [Electrophorus electricus]XP_026860943.2 probable UDP-sugar transporter protein SLC35A5 [Electrophorus electricus]XP_035378968.1 probable UDP-sugar transporter protein SLC35A5 [Electrophorus electricus]
MAPFSSFSCCRCRCRSRLCSRSSVYTLALGLGFVVLGTSRILLLKFSANEDNKYDFIPASVNLMAEAIKLVLCLVMSLRVIIREGRSYKDLGCSSGASFLSCLKWAVPAFLYFLDNLIIFYVMTYLQPAMAVLFSNVVILTTAILFRVVLKRRLSWVQWASLVILFLSIVALTTSTGADQQTLHGLHPAHASGQSDSCLNSSGVEVAHSNHSGPPGWADKLWDSRLLHLRRGSGLGYALLLLQCFTSALANIYNEKILKDRDQLTESIFVQNSKLYVFGLAFNGLTLVLHGESRMRTLRCGLLHGHSLCSAALVVVTAALGLSVAFILKFRDNMFHVLTGQLTTVVVTALSLFLFDFRPSPDFFLQAPVVLLAIFIYHSSRAKDPEFALQQERLRVINGEVFERSRGDGEELERLTKPNTESDSEESF